MNRGVKTALLISCLTVVGCTGAAPVEVRAIDPSAAISRGGDAIAVARGQLVLGNAGLALEAFRKAQRINPADPAALAGIGDCYSTMGRFDLAQSNYEAALAITPHDPNLLLGLAAIYEHQGNTARAMIARAEAAIAVKAVPVVAAPQVSLAIAAPEPHAAPKVSKPVKLSVAAPVQSPEPVISIPKPAVGSITVQLPEARSADQLETQAPPPAMPLLAEANSEAEMPSAVPPAAAEEAIASHLPSVASVTVELPAVKPAEHLEARAAPVMAQLQEFQPLPPGVAEPIPPSLAEPIPPAQPAPMPVPKDDGGTVAVALAPAPRLERLSRGEVALVTSGKSLWRGPSNVRTASGSTVRWVALASASGRPNVQILNAARSQGLATSARTVLLNRGWRKIAVGDAPATLHKSVVLYPKNRAALGQRLARQFGVSAQLAERDDVVLVLGRDAVDRVARQPRP